MPHKGTVRAAALLAAALLAGACGKKGPLYLPDEARAAPASAAPVVARAAPERGVR